MRHRKKLKKLGLPADQRKALLRSLTTELLRHGRITTTLVRARAARKYVDHVVELAKGGTLHSYRQILAWLYDKELAKSVFRFGGERYGERGGGYCRVLRTNRRMGDCAEMAVMEMV